MSIVVVDDNPMNITVVQEILKRAGYTDTLAVNSGSELFELLGLSPQGTELEAASVQDYSHVDLILLDMMMPGIDGITACLAIQKYPSLRDIPIIMVTAIGDSKKLAEALDAGAIDYVTKPINRIELLARIRVALRLKEQNDWHKERDRRVTEELHLAREVQTAVLSPPIAEERISIHAIYRPSEELSGDLYAWHRIDDDRYGVAIIDAMGHGISSSLVCMFMASILKDAMAKLIEPESVMQELNRRACQLDFADQLIQYYFTGMYMLIDLANGTVDYVNAGHPPGMLIHRDGAVDSFIEGGVAIGMFDHIILKKHTLKLNPGDRIILVTDGILDLIEDAREDQMTSLKEKLQAFGSDTSHQELEGNLFNRDHELNRSDDRCLVIVDIK